MVDLRSAGDGAKPPAAILRAVPLVEIIKDIGRPRGVLRAFPERESGLAVEVRLGPAPARSLSESRWEKGHCDGPYTYLIFFSFFVFS